MGVNDEIHRYVPRSRTKCCGDTSHYIGNELVLLLPPYDSSTDIYFFLGVCSLYMNTLIYYYHHSLLLCLVVCVCILCKVR